MPEETTAIDYVVEAASGPHLSGLRLDSLRSSAPSLPSPRAFAPLTPPSLDIAASEMLTPAMPEETTAIDYVMEAASGPHFSGLRLDSLRSSAPSLPSPRASAPPSLDIAAAQKQPLVIGVSGGTVSGKMTVCDMIIQQLHDHRVVLVHCNQDSFYRGLAPEELECVHGYNFDHPDAFDTEQLLECVEKLKCGQRVHVHIYECMDSFCQVNASDVIILEDILIFHDQRVQNLMNMKIFVDTGNSANQAIKLLIQTGVPESHIILLNLILAPEGIHCVCKRFPFLKIVTSEIDLALDKEFSVIPGMGELGNRYFDTDD